MNILNFASNHKRIKFFQGEAENLGTLFFLIFFFYQQFND